MAYKDFVNDKNKGILKDVLMFYGAEDYLMDWAVGTIISDNTDEESRDLDVVRLDGEHTSAAEIMAQSRTYSMFSEKRVVIVRDFLPLYRKTADADLDELLEFSAKPQDSSAVIFVVQSRYSGELTSYAKKLMKACGSYEFARLEKNDLKAFITKRVHGAGKMIARRELEYMIDLSGYYNRGSRYDLAQLDKDVTKLVKSCIGSSIESALIETVLIGDSDRFVFDLTDALMAGDKGRALEIAEAIIRDEDGAMAVLALLTKQFEIMYDALELSEKGFSISAMAKMTGVNEYRFKRAYKAADRYSLQKIKRILTDLYNTDRDIKRGDIDKDVALELMALSACP